MAGDHDHDDRVAIYGVCSVCVSAAGREAAGRAAPQIDDDGHVATTCAVCREPLTLNEPRVHRLVSGWAAFRTGGGTHALRLRHEHHRYAHGACIDRVKSGHLRQPSLALDDPEF